MGRRWSRKRKAESKTEKKQQARPRKDYVPIFQGNPKMEAYYALQGLHNDYLDRESGTFKRCTLDEQREEERLKWIEKLRTILPASFRIGENVHPILRERLEKEMDEFVGTEMEIVMDPSQGKRGFINPSDTNEKDQNENEKEESTEEGLVTKRIAPARKIPFIPHAYQLSLDRRTIRRNTDLQKFHDWLKVQTSAGFVTRQETVSMIPPVVLGVEPHHAVLDMCAAPGSKTSQILELVSKACQPGDLEPRGFVVANDSDPKRAYMLVHQLRRINSPAVFCTSCDAQFFPLLKSKEEKETGQEGMFDRVLCDVPCSGDGTTRKNPGIWKNWNQLGSLALHPLQIAIALNGARLTKVGGYICYSTCSMNPIENEAVVAEILRSADGSLELVDRRQDMKGLMARPGWSSWKVLKEERSRKQQKNHWKKNNAKMKARKQEWEKRRKLEPKDTNGNGETKPMEEEDNDSKPVETTSEEAKQVTTKGDGDTKTTEEAAELSNENGSEEPVTSFARKDLGAPAAWDEETLRARCKDVGLIEYSSFEDVPEEFRRRVRASCFPPTEEEVKTFGLEKCMRCLPHDMDAGGFFVALLRKVAPMSATAKERALKLARELRNDVVDDEGTSGPKDVAAAVEKSTEEEDVVMEDSAETESNISSNVENAKTDDDEKNKEEKPADNGTGTQKVVKGKELFRGRGKTRGDLGNENFIPLKDDIWAPHVEFYGFAPTFPRDQFFARACGEAKVLYFIGNGVKTQLIDRGIQERVTVINSGLKGFERNNKECEVKYRIAQEGIHFLAPHMTKRKIVAKFDDFSKCLAGGAIRLEIFSDEFAGAIRPLSVGSFCVALEGYEHNIFKKMFMVMWRCRGDAVNCLVAKVEMDGMRSKLRAIQEQNEKADTSDA